MTLIRGLDVSTYQTLAEWSPVGLSFLIARASIGTTKDDMYDKHIAKAKAAGLVTGAYHYNWTGANARAEARYFMGAAGDADLLFLDVEGGHAYTRDQIVAFVDEVHSAGKKCGLYMSASVYRWSVGQDYDWIAKWSATPPAGAWEFWQYQGSPLDKDYFNGTIEDLRTLVGKGDNMGLFITLAAAPQVGMLAIPKGCDAIKVADGTHYTVPLAAKRSAYTVALTSATATESGFLVALNGNNAYFIRVSSGATFVPATTYTQAQVDTVVKAAVAPLNTQIATLAAGLAPLTAQLDEALTKIAKAQADLA